jgi:hypothetical protein
MRPKLKFESKPLLFNARCVAENFFKKKEKEKKEEGIKV